MPGLRPMKRRIVDRVEDLSGPAMGLPPERGNEVAHPRFQRLEADVGVVGLAGLVIGAAHDQVRRLARTRLQADVVIGSSVSQ